MPHIGDIIHVMRRNIKSEYELFLTIRWLASESTNIKKRIETAYWAHFIYVKAESMPTKKMQDKTIKIQKRLTKNNTKTVHDTIRCWPLKSCRKIVQEICDLYDDLMSFEWHLHPE